MNIHMLGIDHSNASVEYREAFSLAREELIKVMSLVKGINDVLGCVIISTCNRMEVWVSLEEGSIEVIYKLLCEYKGFNSDFYRQLFVFRHGMDAIEHLFHLASGLKSRIMGEEQIISQVKDALSLSRENECTDHVLEVLFRTAIMAGKKVKTQLTLPRINVSLINQVIERMKEIGVSIEGKSCMVIGNGIIGKEVANGLCKAGGDVAVTVRQYNKSTVQIPEGCKWIYYEERMRHFPKCHIVISTTVSPNYTLEKNSVEEISLCHEITLVDLAVPRDIEPSIGDIPKINLFNIDDFETQEGISAYQEYEADAIQIFSDEIKKFISWYECKNLLPNIQSVTAAASSDIMDRIMKALKVLPEQEQSILADTIEKANTKALKKLLFGLSTQVQIDVFRQCIEGLEKVYQKDNHSKGE